MYALSKKNNYVIVEDDFCISGLSVVPRNKKISKTYTVKDVIITDNKLIDAYVKSKINKKIRKILKKIIIVCNSSDDDSSDAKLALNGLSELKSIIVGEYKIYISKKVYKELLSKIILIEDEFKNAYNEKLFIKHIENMLYEEEMEKSR